jgi:hypothetical protein
VGEIVVKWGGELMAAGVLSIGGYMFRLAYRLEVMERLFKEKRATLDGVVSTSAAHEKRLSVVESVIADLKALTPALQNIATLTSKVETLLETSLERIERLEDRVFAQTTRQQ